MAECLVGLPYPPDFERAWKNLLFCQFHDIIAGSSIEAAYEDARDMLGETKSIAARNLLMAAQAIAWNIQIPEEADTCPIVVFNPHPWAGKMAAQAQCNSLSEGSMLIDDAGRIVPMQRVSAQATPNRPVQFCFLADLPSLGYRTYRLAPQKGEIVRPPVAEAADLFMENEYLRLKIDAAKGCIESLYDKRNGVEVFSAAAAEPVVLDDPSDTWSHDVAGYHDVIGSFEPVKIRLIEQGPVRSVIRVASEYGRSTLRQDFILYRDLPFLSVDAVVDWREQMKALKLRFPVNVRHPRAVCDAPFGPVERPAEGSEEPCQQWADITGRHSESGMPYGLSALNDSKYGYDAEQSTINLTVLRSPVYAWHDPVKLSPETDYAFIDQGEQRFSYALLPHAGDWRDAGTIRRAAELNQKPIALVETFHPNGKLPQLQSFLSAEPANIIITAVKKAEDGSDLVVRGFESAGVATSAVFSIPALNRTIEVSFKPCEIKTLRVPQNPNESVVETSLLEMETQ